MRGEMRGEMRGDSRGDSRGISRGDSRGHIPPYPQQTSCALWRGVSPAGVTV